MKDKICAVLLVSFLSGIVAFAQSSSLTQQASAQFRTAEKAEATLKEKAEDQRSRSDYLRVIESYQRVYLITPHTGWADNALTSIARLYEDMASRATRPNDSCSLGRSRTSEIDRSDAISLCFPAKRTSSETP